MMADANNNLYFIKSNCDKLKFIPTEETIITNKFINNLAIK